MVGIVCILLVSSNYSVELLPLSELSNQEVTNRVASRSPNA